jgi:hypothetical protein
LFEAVEEGLFVCEVKAAHGRRRSVAVGSPLLRG